MRRRVGNELWISRYDGIGISSPAFDEATALAIGSEGNIYVTGFSGEGVASFYNNFATVAYDSSGNQLWEKIYDGPGFSKDVPEGIAVDLRGNVYVTGRSYGDGTEYDYATIKLFPVGPLMELIEKVNKLYDEGQLNKGESNALCTKLDKALKSLNKGNIKTACNQMGAFINQVHDLIKSGILAVDDGQTLIFAAQNIIDSLCGV